MRLYESLGDEPRIFDSLVAFGDTLRQLDKAQEALEPLSRALEIARRRGDRHRVAVALSRLSLAQFYLGQTDEARTLTQEARAICRNLGRHNQLLILTLNLAELEAKNGNIERAIELVKEILPQTSATRFAASRSALLANLSGYLVQAGKLDEAIAVIRETIAVTKERQESVLLTVSLQHAAMISVERGRAADAAARLQGYVDVTFESLGSLMEPVEMQERARLAALLQEQLSGEDLSALVAEGRALNQSDAIAIAMSLL